MKNFRKELNFKIIALLLSMVFLFSETVYPCSLYKSSVRTPLLFGKIENRNPIGGLPSRQGLFLALLLTLVSSGGVTPASTTPYMPQPSGNSYVQGPAGQRSESEETLKEAIKANPSNADNYIKLAEIYCEQKKWKEAAKAIMEAKELSYRSFNKERCLRFGKALLEAELYPDALLMLASAEDNVEAYLWRTLACFRNYKKIVEDGFNNDKEKERKAFRYAEAAANELLALQKRLLNLPKGYFKDNFKEYVNEINEIMGVLVKLSEEGKIDMEITIIKKGASISPNPFNRYPEYLRQGI